MTATSTDSQINAGVALGVVEGIVERGALTQAEAIAIAQVRATLAVWAEIERFNDEAAERRELAPTRSALVMEAQAAWDEKESRRRMHEDRKP